MEIIDTTYAFALPTPQTELSELCDEVRLLAEKEPVILDKIWEDQERHAKAQKKIRLETRNWEENQITPLPGLELSESHEVKEEELTLEKGRSRMSPFLVFLFFILRGYLKGIKSQKSSVLLNESMTIHSILEKHGCKMPGSSTIVENINAVSIETRKFVLDAQLRLVIEEKLDDFKWLGIDSTSVSANSSWPTDSWILSGLTRRLWSRGQSLEKFGLPKIAERRFPNIVKEMSVLHKSISLNCGKRNSKKKIKKFYRQLLKEARIACAAFEEEMVAVNQAVQSANLQPVKKYQLLRLVEWMNEDLESLKKVIGYCTERIEHDKVAKSKDKILSLSDKDAAFIKKGDREPVIGYKPQVGRSKNGLVTSVIVPKGNAADSGQLVNMVDEHIGRTGVTPDIVTTDDGYASKEAKNTLENIKKVKVVSINGSKGKKITLEEDWKSDIFQDARNSRSSVESLIYTLKYKVYFGAVMRRGIENVRAELLEDVLAYNFCRISVLRKKKASPKKPPQKTRASLPDAA